MQSTHAHLSTQALMNEALYKADSKSFLFSESNIIKFYHKLTSSIVNSDQPKSSLLYLIKQQYLDHVKMALSHENIPKKLFLDTKNMLHTRIEILYAQKILNNQFNNILRSIASDMTENDVKLKLLFENEDKKNKFLAQLETISNTVNYHSAVDSFANPVATPIQPLETNVRCEHAVAPYIYWGNYTYALYILDNTINEYKSILASDHRRLASAYNFKATLLYETNHLLESIQFFVLAIEEMAKLSLYPNNFNEITLELYQSDYLAAMNDIAIQNFKLGQVNMAFRNISDCLKKAASMAINFNNLTLINIRANLVRMVINYVRKLQREYQLDKCVEILSIAIQGLTNNLPDVCYPSDVHNLSILRHELAKNYFDIAAQAANLGMVVRALKNYRLLFLVYKTAPSEMTHDEIHLFHLANQGFVDVIQTNSLKISQEGNFEEIRNAIKEMLEDETDLVLRTVYKRAIVCITTCEAYKLIQSTLFTPSIELIQLLIQATEYMNSLLTDALKTHHDIQMNNGLIMVRANYTIILLKSIDQSLSDFNYTSYRKSNFPKSSLASNLVPEDYSKLKSTIKALQQHKTTDVLLNAKNHFETILLIYPDLHSLNGLNPLLDNIKKLIALNSVVPNAFDMANTVIVATAQPTMAMRM